MESLSSGNVDNIDKIVLSVATPNEIMILNVGGKRFETYYSTLHSQITTKLTEEKFLTSHYRKDQGEYFFDKDPDIFQVVLNYLRTGKLHLPSNICGPAIKEELEYWGLSYQLIERCCFNSYSSSNYTLLVLNQLERDRKGNLDDNRQETWKKQTSRWKRTHPWLWAFLNSPTFSKGSQIFDVISMILVFLSIISFSAGTHETFNYFINVPVNNNGSTLYMTTATCDTIANKTQIVSARTLTPNTEYLEVRVKHPVLQIIDIECLLFFTTEYIARMLTSPRKLKFVISVMGVIDFLALIPDYMELVMFALEPDMCSNAKVLNFIKIIKVIRIFRIFHLIRHMPGLWIMIYTLKASIGELILLSTFLMVGIIIFASLIYFVEDRTVFTSIPCGFWWALITMTTVGYGDMYPQTFFGCLIGSLTALSGLLLVGLSVPMLANNFALYYTHVQFALQEENKEKKEKISKRTQMQY